MSEDRVEVERHRLDGGGLVAAEGFYEQGGQPPAPARPPVTMTVVIRFRGDVDRAHLDEITMSAQDAALRDPDVLDVQITTAMEEESWPTA